MSAEPTHVKTEPDDGCCVHSSAPQGPVRLYAARVMGVKVKDEPGFSDEDPVHVKEEYEADCGVSEAAKLADLYMDHRVQGDLVLGLQRLLARDSVFALHAAAVKYERPELQECSMRLEGLLDRSHGTTERDASLDSISEAPVLETGTNHIEDKSQKPTAMKHERQQNLQKCFVRLERLDRSAPKTADQDNSLAAQASEETYTETRRVSDYEKSSTLVGDCWVRLERCDVPFVATTHTGPEVTSAQSRSEQKTVPLQKQKQHTPKNATETNKYICDTCGNTYNEKKWLIRHLHSRKPKKHSCQICNKFKLTYRELIIHTGAKRKSLRKLQPVNIHKRTHTGEKPYSCHICNENFVNSDSLNTHMKIHKGVKPYSCETCHKRFIYASKLKEHQLIHTGIKPYSCETCNKKFAYLNVFKNHLLIHGGIKPYSCNTCNKKFAYLYLLKAHLRIHTKEKSYSCEICKKQFSHSQSLLNHKRVHLAKEPFSCKICDKLFMKLAHLRTHELIHSDKMLWECVICGKKFRQLVDLKQHKLIHVRYIEGKINNGQNVQVITSSVEYTSKVIHKLKL